MGLGLIKVIEVDHRLWKRRGDHRLRRSGAHAFRHLQARHIDAQSDELARVYYTKTMGVRESGDSLSIRGNDDLAAYGAVMPLIAAHGLEFDRGAYAGGSGIVISVAVRRAVAVRVTSSGISSSAALAVLARVAVTPVIFGKCRRQQQCACSTGNSRYHHERAQPETESFGSMRWSHQCVTGREYGLFHTGVPNLPTEI
jgi:hypothetical protein